MTAAAQTTITMSALGGALLSNKVKLGDLKELPSALTDRTAVGDLFNTDSIGGGLFTTRSLAGGGSLGAQRDGPGSPWSAGSRKPSKAAAARKGSKRRPTKEAGWGDAIDSAVEEAMVRNMEQPWCLQSCVGQPACQRVCFPAQNATRLRKLNPSENGGGTGKAEQRGEESGAALTAFGFPEWGTADYSILNLEVSGWVDSLVPEVLGLQVATHRKTSVQRLCLVVQKTRLPPGVGPQEVKNLVRLLKRCDHVNVLNLRETYEDADCIYFMYEHLNCCTLESVLEQHTWTQEQTVNVARECCAAAAFMGSMGLMHLGWTFCHVLLPASAFSGGDPAVCKVFGFGLMGVVQTDSHTHLCWGPECLERYSQQGKQLGNFITKIENPTRVKNDYWSLGAVIFGLISRQPPTRTEALLISKTWQFTSAIDEVDKEARSLIEGFLHANPEKRVQPERALHHEWIRKRWRPPTGVADVFLKLEEFCSSPLPKRLFGRFLTGFLDANNHRQILQIVYALDLHGTGVITLKELVAAAEMAGRPAASASHVHHVFSSEHGANISLAHFAEAYAEDVLDGGTLRHAFESLDDDGSQQISAEELHEALSKFDPAITRQEVVEHIKQTEIDVGGEEEVQDHQLDFAEFAQLFPVRVRRVRAISSRLDTQRSHTQELTARFNDSKPLCEDWIGKIESLLATVQASMQKCTNSEEGGIVAAKILKKAFSHIDSALKKPPGSAAAEAEAAKFGKKGHGLRKHREDSCGFDSWLHDLAEHEMWSTMLNNDFKMLNHAMAKKLGNRIDPLSLYTAAEGVSDKLKELLKTAKGQMQEYEAFSEVFGESEAGLHEVSFSARGLRKWQGDAVQKDVAVETAAGEAAVENNMSRFFREVTTRLT